MLFGVSRSMWKLQRDISSLKFQKELAEKTLSKASTEIMELQVTFNSRAERIQSEIETARELNKKLAEALDAANGALKTANEIIIPGLVSANETFKTSWDAQSAAHVMRNVATRPGTGDVE